MSSINIWGEVQRERQAQANQWDGSSHDDHHAPNDWIAFISYHAGKGSYKADFRQQMIRVAALAVAAIEAWDRKAQMTTPDATKDWDDTF